MCKPLSNISRNNLSKVLSKAYICIHFIFLAHVRVHSLFIQLLSHLSEKITNINQSICLINVLNNTNYPMVTLKSAILKLLSPNLQKSTQYCCFGPFLYENPYTNTQKTLIL